MVLLTHQKNIRNVLAINNVRQTYVEKPSALPLLFMSKYCGMYGTTPPNIIQPKTHKRISVISVSKYYALKLITLYNLNFNIKILHCTI